MQKILWLVSDICSLQKSLNYTKALSEIFSLIILTVFLERPQKNQTRPLFRKSGQKNPLFEKIERCCYLESPYGFLQFTESLSRTLRSSIIVLITWQFTVFKCVSIYHKQGGTLYSIINFVHQLLHMLQKTSGLRS